MRDLQQIVGGSRSRVLLATLALLFGGTGSALAIPSPELVVGSLSSISQLIALVSALLGGGAAVIGVKAKRGMAGASGIAVKAAFAVIALLVIALGALTFLYIDQQNAEKARLEATLTKPLQLLGGKALDPTLVEVSYAEQLSNPRGISTGEL